MLIWLVNFNHVIQEFENGRQEASQRESKSLAVDVRAGGGEDWDDPWKAVYRLLRRKNFSRGENSIPVEWNLSF